MLQIYVTLWGRWFVCACVSLLRTFITLSTLQNPFDKHITYFNQKWLILRIWHGRLVLPIGQVENSSTCPTGQVGKKVIVIPCACPVPAYVIPSTSFFQTFLKQKVKCNMNGGSPSTCDLTVCVLH